MIQRITALALYFFSSLLFSLAGVLYVLLALTFWWVFFYPADQTPHADYYILLRPARTRPSTTHSWHACLSESNTFSAYWPAR
jgi:hypothetical protein